METLSDEVWDVVIAGTSKAQSLLALSLSRSGKKVLHLDRHPYYGGTDAGLSLQDAEEWARDLERSSNNVFQRASISKPTHSDEGSTETKLGSSRAYTLSLNPQIIYARSDFLPKLVSSRIHSQLEFLAVGSWWVHRHGALHKIPSTREDVFNDESLSMKDKRALMKFLRHALQEDAESLPDQEEEALMSLQEALDTRFKIPKSLHAPLLALALSPVAAHSIPFGTALARIRRHMRSMGYFGPGFGAVIAKYGNTSEIAQVACRAGAVGGGVYLLGHELKTLDSVKDDSASTDETGNNPVLLEGSLSDGTRIRSRFVTGTLDDLSPLQPASSDDAPSSGTWKSVNIVADPLKTLFPQSSDNGPVPAAAIVLVDTDTENPGKSPIYLQIHTEDTGECPAGQCVIYASVAADDETAKDRLEAAFDGFIETAGAKHSLLWSLSYLVLGPADEPALSYPRLRKHSSHVLVFPPEPSDISFPDGVLDTVKEAWALILGASAADDSFLKFEAGDIDAEQ
ncbi:hypothetical protein A1O3_03479 [Capronia epimyces CBS 606.96]|uniref:Rab proteins geranylgeranyltransferase n=1 Tax=Capronia epimyces CBS 606.96 TaxID=1182542 RepID=W9Y213_9EURO|nr:uncharacterized protein A1O3_03479 [Capronia epimyces CBS 606.96]EXJ86528.1 hypothetical protein A1O3_03479 [Capronia epimyces CBS 606.96]